jgi:hypothetical protein
MGGAATSRTAAIRQEMLAFHCVATDADRFVSGSAFLRKPKFLDEHEITLDLEKLSIS